MNQYAIITATDSSRFYQALNLVGSLQNNSPGFKEILVYNLGIKKWQLKLLSGLKDVRVVEVPPFIAHWRQCWTWKPWIWKNSGYTKFIYLDGGTEALKSLEELCELVERDGYFLVSQFETLKKGHVLGDIIPRDYFSLLRIPESMKSNKVVAAGILGFDLSVPQVNRVITDTFNDVMKGLNLGWSESELWRNSGLNKIDRPKVMDCPYFRHDQTLFNIVAPGVIKEHLTLGGTWKQGNSELSVAYTHAFKNTVKGSGSIPAMPFGGGEANLHLEENILGLAWGWKL